MGASNRMSPTVTVVLPTYNRERVVLRALDSVLSQKGIDFELIVVDDGSTDSTASLVKRFARPGLRLIRHRRNRGGSAARNSGVRAARGLYVAFIDSDDEWLPGKLSACVSFARQQPDPDLCVIFHRVRVLSEVGVSVSPEQPLLSGERVSHYMFVRRGLIQTSAVLLPTDLARRVPFDESLSRLQDWDFYLRLQRLNVTFSQLPAVLSAYTALDTEDRISSHTDTSFLVEWARQRRDLMSSREYVGFLANKVGPEAVLTGRRLRGASLLVLGLAFGVLPAAYLPIEVMRLLFPATAFAWLRQRKSRSRHP